MWPAGHQESLKPFQGATKMSSAFCIMLMFAMRVQSSSEWNHWRFSAEQTSGTKWLFVLILSPFQYSAWHSASSHKALLLPEYEGLLQEKPCFDWLSCELNWLLFSQETLIFTENNGWWGTLTGHSDLGVWWTFPFQTEQNQPLTSRKTDYLLPLIKFEISSKIYNFEKLTSATRSLTASHNRLS